MADTQRSQSFAAVGALVLMLFAPGCATLRPGGHNAANAPQLQNENDQSGESAQARNVANPNGPLQFETASPRPARRQPVLALDSDPDTVQLCEPTQLTLSETQADSSAARRTLRLSLQNTGAACRLGGFPTITLLGADGRVLSGIHIVKVSPAAIAATLQRPGTGHAPAERAATAGVDSQPPDSTPGPYPQVLLRPHGIASFDLGWTTGPNCEQVSRIAVSAPGAVESKTMSRPFTLCSGKLLITAMNPPPPTDSRN